MPSGEDRLQALSTRLSLMRAFGERLQTLRNKAGLSEDELGERARVNPSIITKVEAGQVDPRLSQIAALARGLGVPSVALIVDLATHTDEPPRSAHRTPSGRRKGVR